MTTETLFIDREAKTRIDLKKMTDSYDQPYYIGKMQFPGVMKLETGASFMVFVSEEGSEQLQIAPLNPISGKYIKRPIINNKRIDIKINPLLDQNGKTYFVGEAKGFFEKDLRNGVFFTIFTSRPGYEVLQIGDLHYTPKKNDEELPEFKVEESADE